MTICKTKRQRILISFEPHTFACTLLVVTKVICLYIKHFCLNINLNLQSAAANIYIFLIWKCVIKQQRFPGVVTLSLLSVRTGSFRNNWCFYFWVNGRSDSSVGPKVTHILWFHTDIFTEPLHGLWIHHLVGTSVLVEPGQALPAGEQFVAADRPRPADLRSSETATKF